jgi:hypothetical protein
MTDWPKSVDYFFDCDHRARGRHFYRSVAVGTLAGMACEVGQMPKAACYLISFLSIAAAIFIQLWFYVKDKDRP